MRTDTYLLSRSISSLRIVRKRPDGYHDLASLFHVSLHALIPAIAGMKPSCSNHLIQAFASQVVDLGDTMTFSAIPGQADALSCDMPGVPLDDSNLVIKVCNTRRAACNKVNYSLCSSMARHPEICDKVSRVTVTALLTLKASRGFAVQALKLFRRHTGSQQFFQVHLEKKVPHGVH